MIQQWRLVRLQYIKQSANFVQCRRVMMCVMIQNSLYRILYPVDISIFEFRVSYRYEPDKQNKKQTRNFKQNTKKHEKYKIYYYLKI